MYEPYKARIAIGILQTAFYRQRNESSNAVFAFASSNNRSINSNSIRLKNSVPNSSSIVRGINKTENQTTPLINTAIRNNSINAITGNTTSDVEIDNVVFYTDYSTNSEKASVSFGGSQKPISININDTKDEILDFIDYSFNRPDTNIPITRTVRYKPSGLLYTTFNNTNQIIDACHDECPRQSPEPGVCGLTYIYKEGEGWIPITP